MISDVHAKSADTLHLLTFVRVKNSHISGALNNCFVLLLYNMYVETATLRSGEDACEACVVYDGRPYAVAKIQIKIKSRVLFGFFYNI